MQQRTRVRNARGEGGRLREELVAAASRLLEGDDPASLTLRGVAREAGVAAPSVYTQFADLDELLRDVVGHHLAALRSSVEAASVGADARTRLVAASHAYCRWGADNPGPYAAVFGGRVVRLLSEADHTAFADGDALLAHMHGLAAAVPDLDPARTDGLVLASWTALHGVVTLRAGKPGYPWPPLDVHVDLVLDGLLRPTGPADGPSDGTSGGPSDGPADGPAEGPS